LGLFVVCFGAKMVQNAHFHACSSLMPHGAVFRPHGTKLQRVWRRTAQKQCRTASTSE
jgi:hypothetical protein